MPPETNTEFLRKESLWEKWMYWKLAIAKCGFRSVRMLVLSLATTLNGSNWENFNGTEKFVALALAVGAMLEVIDAFLSTTMADMKDGSTSKTSSTTLAKQPQPTTSSVAEDFGSGRV